MARLDWLTSRPIAHRALHDRTRGRVENTISAVSAAIERGFSIEVDLQMTADGKVVVFHDDTLDRLTETSGRIAHMELAAIRSTRLRDSDDRIPTLDELLEEVAGQVPLFMELKSHWNGDRRLEKSVAARLIAYQGPTAVMSFDPDAVNSMRKLAPQLPRGLIADRFLDQEWQAIPLHYRVALRHLIAAAYVQPQFVAYDIGALPAAAPLVIRHIFGIPLLTWTVRTSAERNLADRWADQMIFEGFDPEM